MLLQKLKKEPIGLSNGFEDLFNEIVGFPEKGLTFSNKMNYHLPKANIVKNEDSYEIHLSVPGWTKSDFKIELQNSELTISAEKTKEQEENKSNYSHREYSKRSFRRVFTLAEDIEENKISAKYQDGILMIHIPKNKKAMDKEIIKQIKIS